MKTSLRAILRMGRAVVHLIRGVCIIRFRFGSLTLAARQAHIGAWSRDLLSLLGLHLQVVGQVPKDPKRLLLVANHIAWLDIAAIHAVLPQARFVSKADVLHWPVVGGLVAGAGTLFIERERRRDAVRVVHHMVEALVQDHVVAVFPEGTVSDGTTMLPFHANLLQAAVSAAASVLPVVLRYADDQHQFSPAVMYLDDTNLLQSAWRIVCAPSTTITVTLLEPINGLDADGVRLSRRALADATHAAMLAQWPSQASEVRA